MVSRSSFMLKSYGGDSAAKPLIGRQTKVAQHEVKYGGGVQCMHGGGGNPLHLARCNWQDVAKSFPKIGILLWEAIRCTDVLRGGRSKFVLHSLQFLSEQ